MSIPTDFYRLHNRLTGADYDFSASEYDLIVVPVTYCKCDEPFVKTWTDGRVFCTRCGHIARAALQQSASGSEGPK